jgi:hypothetical protein
MMHIGIDPCECVDVCRSGYGDMDGCAAFEARTGVVATDYCAPCKAYTWHKDGACLRCGSKVTTTPAAE